MRPCRPETLHRAGSFGKWLPSRGPHSITSSALARREDGIVRPDYRNFDAEGNEIPPSGETPASPVLPRAICLPPQRAHATEVAADAPHPFRGIRIEFKTPKT